MKNKQQKIKCRSIAAAPKLKRNMITLSWIKLYALIGSKPLDPFYPRLITYSAMVAVNSQIQAWKTLIQ